MTPPWLPGEGIYTSQLIYHCLINLSVGRNPPFQRALQQYLKELDEKAKAKDFFAQFCGQHAPARPEDVNRALKGKVDERWLKPSTTAEILQTLAKIQMNYDGVVNSLSTAPPISVFVEISDPLNYFLVAFDPTPISNAVWACVGALAKVSTSQTRYD